MARCVTFAVARIRVKVLPFHCRRVGNRRNFPYFPSGTEIMGDRRSKKAYTGPRTGIYLHTKFGCDRSIMVGCRSRNDRQTSRQTDEQNGMTIRLTVCERDAAYASHYFATVPQNNNKFNLHRKRRIKKCPPRCSIGVFGVAINRLTTSVARRGRPEDGYKAIHQLTN